MPASAPTGPLSGVKVVELGVWVAGPAAGGILSDWGADVIKIEPPRGDPARTFRRMLGGKLPTNPVFELDNRSKRSIAIDLSIERGRQVALDLIDGADVFLTNIRLAALDRVGLGEAALRRRNPRLVYALVTGYGTGRTRRRPTGVRHRCLLGTERAGGALTPPGGALPFQRGGMGDHTVAMTAAGMVSAALFSREQTGRGDLVSTSLLRQGAYTIGFDVNIALMWGLPVRVGTRDTMGNPTVNNYAAGDSRCFWIVGLEGERHWPPLVRAIGHPEWLVDERFATPADRFRNASALIAELDRVFATRPLADWAEAFSAEPDFFWAPVQTIDELIGDPQFAAAGGLVEVPDETSVLTMLATPADFGERPARPRFRAPRLGEHTLEVLGELGYSPSLITDLQGTEAVYPEDTARGPD